MNQQAVAGYRASSKSHRSCDFCRIAKHKCVRSIEGQKCDACEKNHYICSPGRTAEEFRFLLYGPNGVMLDNRYREGGLRDQSEASFLTIKREQEMGWPSSSSVPRAGQGSVVPDSLDMPSSILSPYENFPSFEDPLFNNSFDDGGSGWEPVPGANSSFYGAPGPPGVHQAASQTGITLAPNDVATGRPPLQSTTPSHSSLLPPATSYAPPSASVSRDVGANVRKASEAFTASTNDVEPTHHRRGTSSSSNHLPRHSLAFSTHETIKIFAELDSLQSIYEHFNEHLERLASQRLCTSKVTKALQGVNDIIERRRAALIGKLVEIILRPSEQASIEETLWIYHVFLRDMDNYELDGSTKKKFLMRARSFYREHHLYLEAEKVLQRCSLPDGDSEMSDFRQLYARSIEETCTAAMTAFMGSIEDWQMPGELNNNPFSTLHRALLHHPVVVSAILASEMDRPPAQDIIGQNVIHAAAQLGKVETLQLYMDAFPDIIEERDSLKRTPLFLAVAAGHHDAAEALLRHRADPNTRSVAQHSVMEICARHGHLQVLKLLHAHQAPIHPQQFKNTSTPLQAAAEFGHYEVVKFLISTGQCVVDFRRLEDDKTAMDLAREKGHDDIVRLLSLQV